MNYRIAAACILILTALGLGVLVQQSFRAREAAREQANAALMTYVIVAAHPLPAGTLARESDFKPAIVWKSKLPNGAILWSADSVASMNGALVRQYIDAGELVTHAEILRPHDRGFLAAVLEPGTSAISVPVDIVSGVSGLIWPGDHVDVLLTETMQADETPLADRVFSEQILRDARVIAIGQNIVQGAQGDPHATAAASPNLYRTVTLEVSPCGAQTVVVAEQLGQLSLVVRSAHSATVATSQNPAEPACAGAGTVYASTVSPALAQNQRPVGQQINLIEGSSRTELTLP